MIKYKSYFLLILLLACFSCEKENLLNKYADYSEHYDDYGMSSPYFANNPLPSERDTLRILSLGNSFAMNALTYLPNVLSSNGVSSKRYSLYLVAKSACSLEQYAEILYNASSISLSKDDDIALYYMGGDEMDCCKDRTSIGVEELISQPWDIITLQQYSALATDYKSFNPYLRYLIKRIRQLCTNPKVTLAWHQAWSYSSDYGDSPYGINRYNLISRAMLQMVQQDGINIIIPSGTAVQNYRESSICGPDEGTVDGVHLNDVTKYLVSFVWCKSLFRDMLIEECDSLALNTFPEEFDDKTVGLLNKCADDAIRSPFWVTPQ